MSNVKGSALTIIALIIGVGGLGIGITSMIIEGPPGPQGLDGTDGIDGTNGIDGVDGVNGTDGVDGIDGTNGTNLVAIWDELAGEGSGFNITLSEIRKNNSDYFYMTDGGNITHLIQPGWYRFTLNLIVTNLEATDAYIFNLYQNGTMIQIFEHILLPAQVDGTVHSTVYAYSDGDDYFSIYCESLGADYFDVVETSSISKNQFVIEYVGN